MASASIVFTKLVDAPADFIMSKFASQTVASGSTSTASSTTWNYAYITAIGGNVWLAITDDGTAPNPSADPRIPLYEGSTIIMGIKPGTKVAVLDLA